MLGFGSTHVYKYDLSDEESLSDEEYGEGLNLAADGDDTLTATSPPVLPAPTERPWSSSRRRHCLGVSQSSEHEKGGGLLRGMGRFFRRISGRGERTRVDSGSYSCEDDLEPDGYSTFSFAGPRRYSKKLGQHRFRRADTNVVTVKFESLIKPSSMHTGDAERCATCNAIFSHISKLTDIGQENEKMWACEFCGQTNLLDLMPDEIPKVDDLTYMLEPAPATTAAGISGLDESLVIFCVDISGSMCVTTEVPGKLQLRGDHTLRLQSLNTERENQFLPGQARNVTHVSRLQGAQGAVDHQLEEMVKEYPNRRVALVAFNNEVVIYGDCSHEPVHLAEHRLKDKDDLVKMGSEFELPSAIKDTRKKLGDTIFNLEEGGATALGPAVLFSVALASQVPGSKVIVCTDGMANVGLGVLDTSDLQTAAEFYQDVSEMAVSKGVSVSVISIKGTNCRMEELGSIADATGGQVNIVDPLRLTQEFESILADRIIATNVTATFITHKGLYIREKDTQDNKLVRYVGNVTLNTEITFEYGIKEAAKKKARKGKSKTTAAKGVAIEKTLKEINEVEMKEDEQEALPKPTPITEPGNEKTTTETTEVEMKEGKEEAGASLDEAPISIDETGPGGQATGLAQGMDVPDNPNDLDTLSDLPFQLQITYTDLDGAKALRVVTQCKPITTDRDVAEKNMNVGVLGVHAVRKTATLAQDGMYMHSRLSAFANNNLVKKQIHKNRSTGDEAMYMDCFSAVQGLERQLQQQQQLEVNNWGNDLDELAEDYKAEPEPQPMCATRGALTFAEPLKGTQPQMGLPSKLQKQIRSSSRDDQLANTTYQMKNANFKKFFKK